MTQPPRPPRLLVSCGEVSGDLYASELLRHLREKRPELEVFGLGGDGLLAQRAHLIAHVRELAVMGLLEIVRSLRRLRTIMRQLLAEVDRERPDLAVLVDYSGFNLRLARELHNRGVPIVYYVSPQVWAWRRGRLKTMRETVKRIMVLFPFEPPIYEAAGIPVTFVGHPLVDLVRPPPDPGALLAELGLDPARPLVAVLPGSRAQEIRYNLPPLADAVARIRSGRPELQFALAGASNISRTLLTDRLGGVDIPVIVGRTHALVGAAQVGLVASGTATVEAALLGTPIIVVYRVAPLSYAIGRRLVRVPNFAMVNLIAGRQVVPELIQHDFTAERVAQETLALLADPERLSTMRADLAEVRRLLGGGGASARAAGVVDQFLGTVS
jgi:lipid-A-disaccharide synthase